MPVINSFSSVPWSFNAHSWDTDAGGFGFGNIPRFSNIYVPLHRDPAVIKATEVIQRPDIAVNVPQAGDTGAAKGQEDQKNNATIERITDAPVATKVGPAEQHEGKGVPREASEAGEEERRSEAHVESVPIKLVNAHAPREVKKRESADSSSAYAKEKKRRLIQREKDFALR